MHKYNKYLNQLLNNKIIFLKIQYYILYNIYLLL